MKSLFLFCTLFAFFGASMCRPSGHAMFFNGKGNVVQTTGTELGDVSFTWELWVNLHSLPAHDHLRYVFRHGGLCGQDKCLSFGFDHEGRAVFGFGMNDLRTDASFWRDVNRFVHWVCIYDHSTQHRAIYRNGILVGEDISQQRYAPLASDLFIGRDESGGNAFHGMMDELRLWKGIALPQETIKQYMGATDLSVHPNADSLLLHYSFDEPSYAVFDHSPRQTIAWIHDIEIDDAFVPLPENFNPSVGRLADLRSLIFPPHLLSGLRERASSPWLLSAVLLVLFLLFGRTSAAISRRSRGLAKKFDSSNSLESGQYTPRSGQCTPRSGPCTPRSGQCTPRSLSASPVPRFDFSTWSPQRFSPKTGLLPGPARDPIPFCLEASKPSPPASPLLARRGSTLMTCNVLRKALVSNHRRGSAL